MSSKFGVVVILIPILNNLVYIVNASFPLQYDIESMSGSSEYMLSGFWVLFFLGWLIIMRYIFLRLVAV